MVSAAGRLRALLTDRLVHYVCRHHVFIIVLATGLSVISGYLATRLTLNTNLADLLPEGYRSVQMLNRIKEQVGHTRPHLVVVTSADLDRSREFAVALADSLRGGDLISAVNLRTNRDFFMKNRLLYMSLADLDTLSSRFDDFIMQKKLEQSPLYFALDDDEAAHFDLGDLEERYRQEITARGLNDEFFLTKQKDGVVLRLYPTGDFTDMKFTNRLLDHVGATVDRLQRQRVEGTQIEVTYSGSFVNQASDYNMAVKDGRSTAIYGIVAVVLLIMIYFRQVVAPLFIVVPLGMSLCWTFGFTYLTIGGLNTVTMVLFAILFGLGIDFGIHILARYREARKRQLDITEAISETIGQTGRALTTTAFTTSIAFGSLMIMDFEGFSHFGFIVGVGVLFALVAMVVVSPAFIILAERLGVMGLDGNGRISPRKGPFPLAWVSLALVGVASGYSLYHLGDIDLEYDFGKLRYPPRSTADSRLPDALKKDTSPAIVLTESAEDAREVVAMVKAVKAARGEASTVASVKSVYSALPTQQSEKMAIITSLKRRLDEEVADLLNGEERVRLDSLRDLLEVVPLTMQDLPENITAPFTASDGRILPFVAINPAQAMHDGNNAIRFADEIAEIHLSSGKTYYASSSNIVFADVVRVVFADGRTAVFLTLAVVFLVVLLDFRRLRDALLVVVPLLAALLWVFGFMHIFDIGFNLYNVIVFPTLIGMGVANTVHILHRYREEGANSLRRVLRTTGKALAATSLTTMAGFSGLVIVRHPGLNSMGLVALVGLANCFLAAVVLLPALLQVLEARSKPARQRDEQQPVSNQHAMAE